MVLASDSSRLTNKASDVLGTQSVGSGMKPLNVFSQEYIYLCREHSAKVEGGKLRSRPTTKSIMSETPVPILATGRTDAIGRQVVALMKPEYEGGCSPLILSIPP